RLGCWKKTNQKEPHYINIEAVESKNKESEQDISTSVVPNSFSEETLSKAEGIVRRFFLGESSRHRSKKVQEQKHPSPVPQLESTDSEGEEESTPISNRFQSLEDMETEDIYQHIANSQNFETPKQVMEAVRGKEDRPPHTVKYKSTTEYYTQEEGEATQLEIILNDATVSNKHKRNKSSEGIIENSTKIGGKGNHGIFPLRDMEATEAEKIFDRDPSEANLIALNKSNAILVHALSLESEYWKQNNNCKWLEAGERNTKYFHALVKKQMLMSSIHRIIEGNREVTDPEQIRDSAAHYFENLLTCNSPRNDLLEFPFHFSTLSEEVTHSICNIPTEEETKEIVFSIDKDSVAGPDDFSSAFYQACWEFIAKDIHEAIRDFFCGTPMPRSFKATTIVLIPKVDSPQTWNDFRPILCNVSNKILSKLLYKKISHALPILSPPIKVDLYR
ncbi:UNVERIFIED_CONTAM: hypothetical protein Sradi_6955400, partial [Sesamum radiatum]